MVRQKVRISVVRLRRQSVASGMVSVADDGPGIPQDAADALLQRGMRLDEATPGHGSDWLCERIAHSYGGTFDQRLETWRRRDYSLDSADYLGPISSANANSLYNTGGTIDKIYFDALSAFEVGESVVQHILTDGSSISNTTCVVNSERQSGN